jgi:tetratricopeptide (TPR) repeat protein
VALEITRGRALAEIGDKEAAKQALAAALDASPDNADALDAFADLCVSESDWSGAEQAWIRLARHVADADRQAEIYRKLANLYDTELPNPQRAELSYREVLKRKPDDVNALERLVYVHGRLGDTAKAMELANQLVEKATTPDEKRDRTLGLAIAYEKIVGDGAKRGHLRQSATSLAAGRTALRALPTITADRARPKRSACCPIEPTDARRALDRPLRSFVRHSRRR